MARKEQKAFLLEKNQKEIIDELSNEEAGIIFKAIYEYEDTKKEPKLERMLKIVFKQFKNRLDEYDESYDLKCQKNKENIDKYWEKVRANSNEYERIQSNTMATNKIKEKENKIKINKKEIKENKIKEEEVKEEENATRVATTHPIFDFPSILDFGKQMGADEDYCQKFFDYYSGKRKKWASDEEWQNKFKDWYEEDFGGDEGTQLIKVGEGAFKI